MSKKKVGFEKLVDTIGRDFFEKHKDGACFSWGEEKEVVSDPSLEDGKEGAKEGLQAPSLPTSLDPILGLYCFLSIDLHPERSKPTLCANIDDWDVHATCYVTDKGVIMGKCELPKNEKRNK